MFNFFKRKKKKVEELENNEVIKETGQEFTDNDNSDSNNDDITNEEYNKFNEANKNNDLIDKAEEKVEELKVEIESDIEKLEDKAKEVSEKISEEEKSSKIKSGRFIDLTKSDNTEKKKL